MTYYILVLFGQSSLLFRVSLFFKSGEGRPISHWERRWFLDGFKKVVRMPSLPPPVRASEFPFTCSRVAYVRTSDARTHTREHGKRPFQGEMPAAAAAAGQTFTNLSVAISALGTRRCQRDGSGGEGKRTLLSFSPWSLFPMPCVCVRVIESLRWKRRREGQLSRFLPLSLSLTHTDRTNYVFEYAVQGNHYKYYSHMQAL